MTTKDVRTYYEILGVSRAATGKEIRRQYRKLAKRFHPDVDKSPGASQRFQKINEAYEVLFDKQKRQDYDKQLDRQARVGTSTTYSAGPSGRPAPPPGSTATPPEPKPEITVYPTELIFGTVLEGQRRSKTFVIENRGGPASMLYVDWESKPDWGQEINHDDDIEPDPNTKFPVRVTIRVNTTSIPSGLKYGKIRVVVDGEVHIVEVYLTVEAVHTVPMTPFAVPPCPKSLSEPWQLLLLIVAVLLTLLVCSGSCTLILTRAAQYRATQTVGERRANVEQVQVEPTTEAPWQKTKAANLAAEQAKEQAEENEILWASQYPDQAVPIRRVRGNIPGSLHPDHFRDDEIVFGEYEVTNNLVHNIRVNGEMRSGCWNLVGESIWYLSPGGTAILTCIEKAFYGPVATWLVPPGEGCIQISVHYDIKWRYGVIRKCLDRDIWVFK